MNAITRPAAASTGGLIPTNVPEALELAKMMATCGMLPEAFRDKPGNALMVVEQSMRWGLSPFAVAQETSVIQGKTFYSGKIMAAAVNNYGDTVGRLRYEYEGAGDERSVRVIGQLRGEGEPREVTVKLRDARTQNKNWAAQPDQQLAYHGARVWGRRHLPEVMLGAYAPEEFAEDERPIRPDPKPVKSTVVPRSKLDPVAAEMNGRVNRMSTKELDDATNGDEPRPVASDDPPWVEDPAERAVRQKPADKITAGVQALLERIRGLTTKDEVVDLVGEPQVEKQRAWLTKHRPELEEEIAEALGTKYAALATAEMEGTEAAA